MSELWLTSSMLVLDHSHGDRSSFTPNRDFHALHFHAWQVIPQWIIYVCHVGSLAPTERHLVGIDCPSSQVRRFPYTPSVHLRRGNWHWEKGEECHRTVRYFCRPSVNDLHFLQDRALHPRKLHRAFSDMEPQAATEVAEDLSFAFGSLKRAVFGRSGYR